MLKAPVMSQMRNSRDVKSNSTHPLRSSFTFSSWPTYLISIDPLSVIITMQSFKFAEILLPWSSQIGSQREVPSQMNILTSKSCLSEQDLSRMMNFLSK